jgi:hypothetical protein
MTFQVEITPINVYRLLFAVRDTTVNVLYVRHSAQAPLTIDDITECNPKLD